VHAVRNQVECATDSRRHHRHFECHRFEDRIRSAFGIGRLNKDVQRVEDIRDVVPMSDERAMFGYAQPLRLCRERWTKRSAPRDDEVDIPQRPSQNRGGLDQDIKSLFVLQTADRANDSRGGRERQRGARCSIAIRMTSKAVDVNSVPYERDAIGS